MHSLTAPDRPGLPVIPAQGGTQNLLSLRPLGSENAAMLTSPLAELLLFIPKKHFCVSLGAGAVCAGSGDPVQSYRESLL